MLLEGSKLNFTFLSKHGENSEKLSLSLLELSAFRVVLYVCREKHGNLEIEDERHVY